MFKKLLLIITTIMIFSQMNYGQGGASNSIAMTVYNANLGVVKETRNMNINSGTSTIAITDVAQHIDPTSVHIKLDGEVLEQNYQYDLVSMDKILNKYLDKDIQMMSEKNEMIEGKLLSASGGQIVLEKKEGGLIMLPSTSKYVLSVGKLPEGLITKPTLVWMVNSNSSGKQDVEISYQTSGMNWHAEYVAILNESDTKIDLNSWVSVDNNSGTTYKNATLKLVAGDLNLITGRAQPPIRAKGGGRETYLAADQQFEEKELFEYHIYNLKRPTTLAQSETKQISLFESENVGVTKKFLYRSGGYYYGSGGKGKVAVVVELDNTEKNNLGIPMPKGKVRVYKSDGETIEFIGEDLIDHTPKKEKIKLKIGDAFDVVAEEVQTENKRITDKVYEQAYDIKLKNRKNDNIVVEVERVLGNNWEILSSTIKYEKKDARTVIFKVPIKKDSETTLSFKVRYVY